VHEAALAAAAGQVVASARVLTDADAAALHRLSAEPHPYAEAEDAPFWTERVDPYGAWGRPRST
jgi:hypothetical protein